MTANPPTQIQLPNLNAQDANFAVDAVDAILSLAMEVGASDVHLQPRTGGWEVLYRIDGVAFGRRFFSGWWLGGSCGTVDGFGWSADLS